MLHLACSYIINFSGIFNVAYDIQFFCGYIICNSDISVRCDYKKSIIYIIIIFRITF